MVKNNLKYFIFLGFIFLYKTFYSQSVGLEKNNTKPYLFEDINNDGIVDVITADYLQGSLYLHLNNGSGFNSPVFIDVPVYLSGTNQDLSFADFDNNGFNDLLISTTYGQTCGNNNARIYWNAGTGSYFSSSTYTNFPLTNPYCSFAFGVDGNNDNARDVFVTTMGFTGSVKPQMTWKNVGSQSFTSMPTIGLLRDMYGPIEGDFNNDGNKDLMFFRDNWAGGPAGYHTIFGNGNHSYSTPHIEFSTTSMQTLGVIKLKPLVANKDYALIKTNTQNSNEFIIAEWTGNSFQHVYKSFPSNISFFKVLDANQDGYEDILGVLDSANQEHLIPYYNDGNGNLIRGNSLYSIGVSKAIIRAEYIGNNLTVLTETTDSLFVDLSSINSCNIPITTKTEIACSSYTSPSGNYTWTNSGTYNDTLQTLGGCDSILQINLTINYPSMLTYADTGVSYYLWHVNNRILTVSGIYSDTLTNSNSCDSIIQLDLTLISKGKISLTAIDSVICSGENSAISISSTPKRLDSSFTIKVNSINQGVTASNQFKLSGASGSYSLIAIDSTTGAQQIIDTLTNEQTITFDNGPGVYYLKISPLNSNPLHKFQFFGNNTDNLKLLEVLQWGNIKWSTMSNMFNGCENLIITTTDIPILSQVNNMQYMFFNCKKLNGPNNMNNWDVSGATTMEGMFRGASNFNQPLNNWNTSNLTNTRRMFQNATLFNQPLHNWDVSKVTNMSYMFVSASSFNQPIGNWDVSSVIDMSLMFYLSSAFNKDIGNWDVSSVTNMSRMFSWATSFNRDLASWNVSSVNNMNSMFDGAISFNKDLDSWDVSNVIDFSLMFWRAARFNGAIVSWNTINAVNMNKMFYYSSSFNQDIGQWNVSNVTDMTEMFMGTNVFNQNLSSWCVTNITSQPSNFSTNSALTPASQPVWGTCPAQYPAGTVHCDPNNPTAVVDVTNPITGKTWMDRNLGASQAAQSPTDTLAYGDLYQWGRGADGHQCRNSATTSSLSSTDTPGHGDFIINGNDWRNPQNPNLWQGVNGINNPCPSGYRIPTAFEISSELSGPITALTSILDFTISGTRDNPSGTISNSIGLGVYATSSIQNGAPQYLYFDNGTGTIEYVGNGQFGLGTAIRCIKD